MKSQPMISKLALIIKNCVDLLQDTVKETYQKESALLSPEMQLLASSPLSHERRKDRKTDDEEFLPNGKYAHKNVISDKIYERASNQFDMKMILRRKLLKIRPKPPVNAFIAYVQEQKERIGHENPKKSIAEITSIASKEWKDLPQDVKQPYIDQYDKRQKQYHVAQQKFINENPEFRTLSKSIRNRSRKSLKQRGEFPLQENFHKISSDSEEQEEEQQEERESPEQVELSDQEPLAEKGMDDGIQEDYLASGSFFDDDEI